MPYRIRRAEYLQSANPAVEDVMRCYLEGEGAVESVHVDVPFVDGQPPTQAEILAALCAVGYEPNDLGECV